LRKPDNVIILVPSTQECEFSRHRVDVGRLGRLNTETMLRPERLPDGRVHVPVACKREDGEKGEAGARAAPPEDSAPGSGSAPRKGSLVVTKDAFAGDRRRRVPSLSGSSARKGCLVTKDMFDHDKEVTSACGKRNFAAAEKIIGYKKSQMVGVNCAELCAKLGQMLVGQIRKRVKNNFFEEPVDKNTAPGYYALEDNTDKTEWNTDAMCFQRIEKKDYKTISREKFGGIDRPDAVLALVEHDLNLIVYNAIIYNPKTHPVNLAAQRLFHGIQKVMGANEVPYAPAGLKWEDCRFCSKCNGDEVYFENPINICDWCCVGTHKDCMPEARPADQGLHPLRPAVSSDGKTVKDEAWFCSDACRKAFDNVSANFKLPDEMQLNRSGPNVEKLKAYKDVGRVVLARQCKGDPWCFGVTIKPESREQQSAAAEAPSKIVVLWPHHNRYGRRALRPCHPCPCRGRGLTWRRRASRAPPR